MGEALARNQGLTGSEILQGNRRKQNRETEWICVIGALHCKCVVINDVTCTGWWARSMIIVILDFFKFVTSVMSNNTRGQFLKLRSNILFSTLLNLHHLFFSARIISTQAFHLFGISARFVCF